MRIQDAVRRYTECQRLGLALQGTVLERKLAGPQERCLGEQCRSCIQQPLKVQGKGLLQERRGRVMLEQKGKE